MVQTLVSVCCQHDQRCHTLLTYARFGWFNTGSVCPRDQRCHYTRCWMVQLRLCLLLLVELLAGPTLVCGCLHTGSVCCHSCCYERYTSQDQPTHVLDGSQHWLCLLLLVDLLAGPTLSILSRWYIRCWMVPQHQLFCYHSCGAARGPNVIITLLTLRTFWMVQHRLCLPA
jgi:hypothetical protein